MSSASPAPDAPQAALLAVLGFALVAAAQVSNMLMARGLGGHAPPFTLAFLRWSIIAAGLAPFVWRDLRGGRLAPRGKIPSILAAAFCGFFLCGGPVYVAGATTTAINIALIMTLSPLMVLVFSRLLGIEKIGAYQASGMAMAFAGALAIIARGDPHFFTHLEAAPGDILIFGAMIGWSIYTILQSRVAGDAPVLSRVGMFAAAGALLTAPVAVWEVFHLPAAAFDRRLALAALFTGLVPGLFAYCGFAWMAGRFGSVRASIVLYLGPIIAALLSYAILGEPPGPIHLLGGALILSGVWLSLRR